MTIVLLLIYFVLFASLVWRNQILGLALVTAFLPSYLIRFSVWGLPATLLEGMILITVFIWIIKRGAAWKNIIQRAWPLKSLTALPQPWFQASTLFLTGATVSVFVSPDPQAALGVWKAYFAEPLLFFAVLLSTIKKRKDFDQIIWGLVLGALPAALLAVIQKFTGWFIPNPFWQAEATRRVTSFFGYPNAVALYLAPLLPLMFYLLIKFPGIKNWLTFKTPSGGIKNVFLIFILGSSFLAIVFAKSTGALAALAGVAFFFGLINKKIRWWIAGLIILSAFLIPLTSLKEPFTEEFLLRGDSGFIRINMWAETLEMLKERPFFGAGLAGYQSAVSSFHILPWAEIYLYPHNLFLNFWSETGLLGLIGFLWLVGLFFAAANLAPAANETTAAVAPSPQKYLLASLMMILIHGLVDVPYFKNDLSVMFWTLAGLMLISTSVKMDSSPKTMPIS